MPNDTFSTTERTCGREGCGKPVLRRSTPTQKQKYCSRACMGLAMCGVARPDVSGPLNSNWKGGVSTENKKARETMTYKAWRAAVYFRDDFLCQLCPEPARGVKLEANHIRPFAECWLLRLHVPNGITLCAEHHHGIRGKESEYEKRFTDIVRGKPMKPLTEKQLASLRRVERPCSNDKCGKMLSRKQSEASRSKHWYCGRKCQDSDPKYLVHGESHHSAKLTVADIPVILAASERGETHRSIARRYGVTRANIGYIVRRVTWKHIA